MTTIHWLNRFLLAGKGKMFKAYLHFLKNIYFVGMLVLTTMFISMSGGLPKTSYVKLIDIWFIFCLVITFWQIIMMTLLEALRFNLVCHLPWLKVIFHLLPSNFCFHVLTLNSFIYSIIFHEKRS